MKNDGGPWTPNASKDINRRLVYAASKTGIGREGMATICQILNMPQPMSSEAWSDHMDALYKVHKSACEENLETARNKLGQTLGHENNSEIVDIAVAFDGTWSKRGHTANFGFGFAHSVDTG